MFLIIDLETTNREPEQAHVVEWAILATKDLLSDRAYGYNSFIKPPISIPPETSAIHHIVDFDVREAPSWEEAVTVIDRIVEYYREHLQAFVAHNTGMERKFIEPIAPNVPWLCTYKAALRVWPEAPGHSNEALRYWLTDIHQGGIVDDGSHKLAVGLGRSFQQFPHSAAHDVRVTARILGCLLDRASVADMVRWESEPTMLPRCPIGEYRNLPWSEVPSDWLAWALSKPTMREDVVFCAREELKRREDDIESIVF